jgi:ElaB/YqjD/DUF883 family membrane-anchored ribosome-binding protein
MNTQGQDHSQVLDRVATDVGQRIRETADQLGETTERVSEGLQSGLDNLGKDFSDVRDSVVDRTREYSQTTKSYVRKNPWVVIGLSAGFAFLVGMLIGRRSAG